MKTTDKPILQDFHIDGVKHITSSDAMEAVNNGEAILLDVREEYLWKLEWIALDNVYYQPMSAIMEKLSLIPKDKAIIVFCHDGVDSTKAVHLLNQNDFKEVANLDGGFKMWKSQGFPFERSSWSACGCGCSK